MFFLSGKQSSQGLNLEAHFSFYPLWIKWGERNSFQPIIKCVTESLKYTFCLFIFVHGSTYVTVETERRTEKWHGCWSLPSASCEMRYLLVHCWISQAFWPGGFWRVSCFYILCHGASAAIINMHCCVWLYVAPDDLSSGPHTWMANTHWAVSVAHRKCNLHSSY